jgi:phosphatidylinositol alpha-1,6-mannosyltransferase
VNVLFISIDLFSIGGIQRYSRYLLDALRRSPRIERLRVASLAAPHAGGFDAPVRADATGGRGVLAKLGFAAACWRLARARQASLLIVDHVYLAPIAWLYGRLTGTPYWLNVYAIEVWGDLSWLRRRALLGAACIVSDCDYTRCVLGEKYPPLAGRIIVVPDCVDVERFVPDATRTAEAMPVVLTVSRLAEGRSKGHDAVLRALAGLRARGVDARYVIAGDGADRARLETLAHELGLADRVRFAGRVPDAALPALYASADVFALVSAFDGASQGEGVPLVVLEAQACGVPAITGSRDGSAESIVDGETGLLVDPADDAAIAGALGRLIADAGLRARMGAAARAFTERQCSFPSFETKIDAVVVRFAERGAARAMRPVEVRR